MRQDIDENQAAAMIEEYCIHRLEQTFPAGITFLLGNGKRLTLWDAGYEHGRHWVLDR